MIRLFRRTFWLLLIIFAAAPLAQADGLKVENGNGDTLFKIKVKEQKVKILEGEERLLLEGKLQDDGDRKYKRPSGATFARVKGKADGFKLKGENGDLLWKVKNYADRIEIARTEEMVQPDVLRRTEEDQWDLERNGVSYGKLKYYPDKQRTKLKDADNSERFQIDGERFSPAAGALLIPGILRDDAYVIMTEIWLRGW